MRTKNNYQTPGPNKVEPHLWVNKYADYLFAYACLRINDDELAKDLVQETFLGALEHLEKFDRLCSEKTWLTAILKNKILDVYRNRSSGLNRQSLSSATDLESDEFFDPETGHWKEHHYPAAFVVEQPDALQNIEFQGILQSCMKDLPPLWVSAFTMKYMDGESTETICTELKLTPSNFWVIMHRSKVHLRSYLQKNWI
ncbi:MAG: sigma-70 family RNA polymerase sigma factor [Dyadobacter sp.]